MRKPTTFQGLQLLPLGWRELLASGLIGVVEYIVFACQFVTVTCDNCPHYSHAGIPRIKALVERD